MQIAIHGHWVRSIRGKLTEDVGDVDGRPQRHSCSWNLSPTSTKFSSVNQQLEYKLWDSTSILNTLKSFAMASPFNGNSPLGHRHPCSLCQRLSSPRCGPGLCPHLICSRLKHLLPDTAYPRRLLELQPLAPAPLDMPALRGPSCAPAGELQQRHTWPSWFPLEASCVQQPEWGCGSLWNRVRGAWVPPSTC